MDGFENVVMLHHQKAKEALANKKDNLFVYSTEFKRNMLITLLLDNLCAEQKREYEKYRQILNDMSNDELKAKVQGKGFEIL